MPRNFLTHAGFALMLSPVFASAAPLTLDEAVQRALTHNPELRAADRQTQAAQARAQAAQVLFRPQVDLRYMARRSDNPLDAFADKLNTRSVTAADLAPAAINEPGTSSVHVTQLSIELPLYTGGRLVAQKRAADDAAEAARLAYEHRRLTTVYNTIQAYRSAQAGARGMSIADDAVEAAREHAATTARLARQGRIAVSDRMTAELNLASVLSLREQAAHRQRLALDDLRRLLGLSADAELSLPPWEPTPVSASMNPSDSTQRGLTQRKDLQAQSILLNASRSKIGAARAAFQPQVSVIAADSWYADDVALDNKSQSIMGVVSMNLFNGGRDWHGLTAAQHETAESELRLEAMRESIRSEVHAAASRLMEADARRRIAAESVNKARETVRLVKQRYGEGRTILIDLLMSERVLVEARNEELTAALNQELSAAQLQLAEGSLALPSGTFSH